MLGGEGGRGSAVFWCAGADGQRTEDTGHMKHEDSEEMLSGETLLEVDSHIHTG